MAARGYWQAYQAVVGSIRKILQGKNAGEVGDHDHGAWYRMGRFLMNVMLASGGYRWTVIPVNERRLYMSALEQASVQENIMPFARFLGGLFEKGFRGERYPATP